LATDPNAPLPNANLRAPSYYIARTCVACPHCGAATLLTALALGAGHEARDDELGEWEAVQANAFCFYVAAVSRAVYRRLRRTAPNFKFVRSEGAGDGYWANHCQHCDLVISDEELHGEPGVHGFALCSEVHAANVDLMEVREAFEASAGGYALEPEFFALMRRA
jgi:hypothetical protein